MTLFHFTRLLALPSILDTDELRPRWSPRVCLTRDQNHIYTLPGFRRDAVLVLDEDRVRLRHRLVPTRGDIERPRNDAKWATDGLRPLSPDEASVVRKHGRECEERVAPDGHPMRGLRACLLRIVVHEHPRNLAAWERFGPGIRGRCAALGIPIHRADFGYHRAWFRDPSSGDAVRR